MDKLAPNGPVYQAGTLSGNPLAMAAGAATLKILQEKNNYETLEKKTSYFCDEIKRIFKKRQIPICINRAGSMFTLFFTDSEVFDFTSASRCDTKRFALYFRGMLANRISIPPSQFETSFVSLAHTDEDIETTIKACDKVIKDF